MKTTQLFKMSFLFSVLFFTLNLEANPAFARQYDLACSSCHTQAPALNEMGLGFLRNGFRMSSADVTTLQRLRDTNSSNHYSPIGAIIGLSTNSNSDGVNQLVKLYLSGTLTDSLSFMALTKESFSPQKQNQELFVSNNSQLYAQYNLLESKHAVRAGLLSPLTQLGNIERSMGHSGLHINDSHGNRYVSPLQNTNIKKIKGAEYSYLSDNNILLLVSYGKTTNSGPEDDLASDYSDSSSFISHQTEERDNNAFLGGITYKTASNYRIGLIYNQIDLKDTNQYSLLVPIEKEYPHFIWNSALVYVNALEGTYVGLENVFTVPLRDMEHLKVIVNADKDQNNGTNFGYSLGYTNIYKMFIFSAVAGRVNTEIFTENKLNGAINIIF